jgi:hypothetical protein
MHEKTIDMKLKQFTFASLVLLSVSGCQTGPVTQAQIDSTPSWTDNSYVTEARRCTKEFGFQLGTPAFGECMRALEQDRMNRAAAIGQLRESLINQGVIPSYGSQQPASTGTFSGTGYLKGQTTSGQVRSCSYNQMGQTVVVSIPITDICPLNN